MFEDWLIQYNLQDEEFAPLISITEDEDDTDLKIDDKVTTIPVLALKNTVLYPGVVIPITIGRDKSIKAVQKSHKGNKLIAVLSQKNSEEESPSQNDLFEIGTVARVIKMLKMPDGSSTAILQGKRKFKLHKMVTEDPLLEAEIEYLTEVKPPNKVEFNALMASIKDMAKKIIEFSPQIPSEAVVMLQNIKQPSLLLNFIASNLNIDTKKKQEILEIKSVLKKGNKVLEYLDKEIQILEIRTDIESRVRGDIEKQQRDYYLNQQLKMIQEELGNNPQDEQLAKLKEKADAKSWPAHAKETFDKGLARLQRINPQVAEYSVSLTYLELLVDLPWDDVTDDNFDLKNVKKVLDKDHYGLEEVKDRIIEHLAVLKLKGDMKAPIICLVGPPGVGKTSLGKSIASALKRKFVRMSLGGLHDESEIRGHRKTYIGALPGRIIQSIKKSKSSNPVFILDEIDKIGKDFRGDPSSALLEVLDPEQNSTFQDNYLEIEYDLSKVLFIATANSLSTIQPALLDRMEIIDLSGYSTEEKIEIAKQHLIPEQRKNHGVKAAQVKLKDDLIKQIVMEYTRESGVRSLSRQIAGVMRHVAKHVATEEKYNITVQPTELKDVLGPSKFSSDDYSVVSTPGVAVGLAWTRVGGDILFIEASLSKGKGKLTLTGNLGDVMKESATTALSFIKSRSETLGISADIFEKNDIHIHVPQGATPKDGPSAGITIASALASILKGKPVKPFLAMTGEITLRGKVLPVGGIKEKILAAKRSGIKEVMMCKENQKHVERIKPEYLKELNFIYVDNLEEVLDHAIGFSTF